MKALAIFTDPDGARFGWILKPGYRHVFACLNDGNYWTMFDWRDGQPVVQTVEVADVDLGGFFESEKYRVLELTQGPPVRVPLVVNNCVGMTKLVLCIHAPLVQTPYALYQFLRKLPC